MEVGWQLEFSAETIQISETRTMAKTKITRAGKGKKGSKANNAQNEKLFHSLEPEAFFDVVLPKKKELKTDPAIGHLYFLQDVIVTASTDKDPDIRRFEWDETTLSITAISHPTDRFVLLSQTEPNYDVLPEDVKDPVADNRRNSQVTFTFIRVSSHKNRIVVTSSSGDDIVVTIQTGKKKP
jgi:hypothetical protein